MYKVSVSSTQNVYCIASQKAMKSQNDLLLSFSFIKHISEGQKGVSCQVFINFVAALLSIIIQSKICKFIDAYHYDLCEYEYID